MIAGYTIFFLVSAIYLLSMVIRRRNLEQDLKTLESIRMESKAAAPSPKPAAGARRATRRRTPTRKKVTRKK